MKQVMVNGERFRVKKLVLDELKPGALVSGAEHRRAYRLVCFDGGDAILRNMRHPELLDATPAERLEELFVLIEPDGA